MKPQLLLLTAFAALGSIDLSAVAALKTTDDCNDPIGARPVKPYKLHANRNQPCPCGSGLKFKLCCRNK